MHKIGIGKGGGVTLAKWHYGELARNERGIDSDQSIDICKYPENKQLRRDIHQNNCKLLQNTHRTPCLKLNIRAAFQASLATIRNIKQ